MLIREPALWREPPRGGFVDPALISRTGLEQLQATIENPPLARLTGMHFDGASAEQATFSFPVSPWLGWTAGSVPGGVAAIPLDAALGCALQAGLPPRTVYTTAELSLTYVRPLQVGESLVARGHALHAGRSMGFSTAELRDPAGRLLVAASSRCAVFSVDAGPGRGGTSAPPRDSYPEPAGTGPDPYLREAPAPPHPEPGTSGLEQVRGLIVGSAAPPLHHLIGVTPMACDAGRASVALPLSGWLGTPFGWPQGGFLVLLADLALVLAAHTTCAAGERAASVDVKVNFLRPVACDGSIVSAAATVLHRGRSLVVCSAEVSDAEGKRVALATGSSQVLREATG